MTPLKVQAEIRFTPILDFREIYRPIVSPYLKLSEFEISNPDTFNEFIILKFKDEGIALDIRWDRAIFICDGKKDNLFSTDGPMSHFVKILQKLEAHSSFGKITEYVLAEWNLFLSDRPQAEIVSSFKEKYLTNLATPQGDYPLVDLAIQQDFKEKDNTIRFNFGPFRREHDIETYKLRPISSKHIQDILTKNGIISQNIHFMKASTVDMDIFRKMSVRNNILTKVIRL